MKNNSFFLKHFFLKQSLTHENEVKDNGQMTDRNFVTYGNLSAY